MIRRREKVKQFKNRWMEARYWLFERICVFCKRRIRIFVWGDPFKSRIFPKRDQHVIGICPTPNCPYGVQKFGVFTDSQLGAHLGSPIEEIQWDKEA